MSDWEGAVALDHWRRMEQAWPWHLERLHAFVDSVDRTFGPESVSHLKNAENVAMAAIRVPPSRRNSIAAQLADAGIQTTWYYYPLHLLKTCAASRHDALPMSELLASQVLILPLSWPHAEQDVQVNWLNVFARVSARAE